MADVARAAGVSRSTVSYVLSGERPISEQTRQRVLEAMQALHYTPNVFAQGLAGKRTGIIALIFPIGQAGFNLTDFEYIQAASEQARTEGYQLLLWPYGADDVEELKKVINQGIVEGVVLMEVRTFDPRVQFLLDTKMPFITIGRTTGEQRQAFVDSDFEAIGEMAIDFAAERGHTRCAYLTRPDWELEAGHGPTVKMRAAVLRAAEAKGMDVSVFPAPATFDGGWDIYRTIRTEVSDMTALLTFNEAAVPGFLAAAMSDGLRIPEDLSIIGLNSSDGGARTCHPALTTFSVNHRELAQLAVGHLVRSLNDEKTASFQTLLSPQLTERASTPPEHKLPGGPHD
ncbi:LacI family DNA-binding transcriptional regulator [Paenarthrobacter sp. NPDC092416]|uniref:LacI family DNA-binding transcriptional regulator n=1 Tax=Paenarthrobacter sp. NPDC092416 TaxID=3364386 RepID=UPI00382C0AC4